MSSELSTVVFDELLSTTSTSELSLVADTGDTGNLGTVLINSG